MVWAYFIIPLVAGLFLYALVGAAVSAPGKMTQQKFQSLGVLSGKSEAEIVAVVGPPTARSAVDGGYLLQWMQSGYHICLTFSPEGVCQGVTHEVSV